MFEGVQACRLPASKPFKPFRRRFQGNSRSYTPRPSVFKGVQACRLPGPKPFRRPFQGNSRNYTFRKLATLNRNDAPPGPYYAYIVEPEQTNTVGWGDCAGLSAGPLLRRRVGGTRALAHSIKLSGDGIKTIRTGTAPSPSATSCAIFTMTWAATFSTYLPQNATCPDDVRMKCIGTPSIQPNMWASPWPNSGIT